MNRLRRNRKRGTMIIAVLVVLSVIMGLIGQMLLSNLRSSRQLRRERDLRQCEFLLEAAAHRVAKEFAGKSAIDKLEWKVSSSDIVGLRDGRVHVEHLNSEPDRSQWRIVAEYPVGNEWSIRRSKTVWVNTPKKSED